MARPSFFDRPWTEQPQEAVGVDWGNPLTAGLDFAVIPASNRLESINGAGAGAPDDGSRLGGVPLRLQSASSQYFKNSAPKVRNFPLTFLAIHKRASRPSDVALMSIGAGTQRHLLYINQDAVAMFSGAGGAADQAASAAGALGSTTGPARWTAGRVFGAGSRDVWLDGVKSGTNTATITTTDSNVAVVGAYWNNDAPAAGFYFNGSVYLAAAWNRALSDHELQALYENPWQLFEPRRISVPVSAAGGDTTITASVGEASATGVTARLNSTLNAGPAAASAAGVTALLNTTVQSGPGVASAAGVTALLNTSVNGTPAEASATGVTASIATAGNTTISAAPGEASATGVSTHVDITLNAAPAAASATGVSVTMPRAIGTTPGEASADGLAAQLQRIFGTTAGEAIAAGVTATISSATATVGRPVSDTSNTGWAASTGSDLYAMVDEVTPSATDYIVATSVGAVCELALNGTGYPGTASQVLKFRASSSTGNSVIVRLKNTGGATVRTATQALTSVDTEYSLTLTAGEIAAITSGALSVQLESA